VASRAAKESGVASRAANESVVVAVTALGRGGDRCRCTVAAGRAAGRGRARARPSAGDAVRRHGPGASRPVSSFDPLPDRRSGHDRASPIAATPMPKVFAA
jgi:hypothetical protein